MVPRVLIKTNLKSSFVGWVIDGGGERKKGEGGLQGKEGSR